MDKSKVSNLHPSDSAFVQLQKKLNEKHEAIHRHNEQVQKTLSEDCHRYRVEVRKLRDYITKLWLGLFATLTFSLFFIGILL